MADSVPGSRDPISLRDGSGGNKVPVSVLAVHVEDAGLTEMQKFLGLL